MDDLEIAKIIDTEWNRAMSRAQNVKMVRADHCKKFWLKKIRKILNKTFADDPTTKRKINNALNVLKFGELDK